MRPATLGEHARVRAEAHRAALFGNGELIDHKVDNRGAGVWIELGAVRIGITKYMTGKGDGSALHTETKTKVGNIACPCVVCSEDFAFDAAVTEPARYQNSTDAIELFDDVLAIEFFGRDPAHIDFGLVMDARMSECFDDTQIRVVEFDVFADEGNGDACFG